MTWRMGALTSRGWTIFHPTDKTHKGNPDVIIAYVVDNATTVRCPEALAHARLIAAAPALLEALINTTQTLRLLLVPMDPIDADSRSEVRNEIKLAEAAVKLAKEGQ